jgi:hypothetical protein
MVRRAFADVAEEYEGSPDDRALTAHTGWLDATVAGQALREIGRYNAFHAETVAEGLEEMPEDAFFSVGREGSPVLYVTTRHPEDAKQVLRDLERDRPAVNDELQKYVRGGVQLEKVSVAPDELSSAASTTYPHMADDGGERHVIRAWWD